MSSPNPTTLFDFVTTGGMHLGAEAMEEYLWLVILGAFVCFAMAWGIGANDVANAFGTSVGAKAITLKQATVLAAIFEFVGALGLGSAVTKTVRKGITDYAAFEGEEDLLMLGMFCALISAALWLFVATKYSLPVSTTQAIVGAIAGFSFTAKGVNAVEWSKVIEIIIFWLASPILAGLGCIIFFFPLRTFLLRRKDSYKKTLLFWPFFVFVVAFIMVLFLLIKGLKRLDFDVDEQMGLAFGIAAACGLACAILAYFIFICSGVVDKRVHYVVKKIEDDKNKQQQQQQTDDDKIDDDKNDDTQNRIEMLDINVINDDKSIQQQKEAIIFDPKSQSTSQSLKSTSLETIKSKSYSDILTRGVNVDIHNDLEQLEVDIQNNSEKFDIKTEKAFAWLQVCTASLGGFAHGSNDVANAVAPFAAMISLYEYGQAQEKTEVPIWVLTIGAIGIVIGLATYGYKIIKTLGVRMAGMSSTRGYCIELSSALTVILASSYGMPASTTHAQVGATVAVGLMEITRSNTALTWRKIINWKLLGQVFLGWIATLIVSGVTCSILYSLLAYSPYAGKVIHQSQLNEYEVL